MPIDDELTAATVLSTRTPPVTGPAEEEVESALADRLGRMVELAVEVLAVDGVGLMLLDQHDALRTAGYTTRRRQHSSTPRPRSVRDPGSMRRSGRQPSR